MASPRIAKLRDCHFLESCSGCIRFIGFCPPSDVWVRRPESRVSHALNIGEAKRLKIKDLVFRYHCGYRAREFVPIDSCKTVVSLPDSATAIDDNNTNRTPNARLN